MVKVECNNLHCWADSARYLHADSWRREIAVISLYGPRNAVRAAWARLVSSKKKHEKSIRVGEDSVTLQEGTKYLTISTPMTRQMLHVLLVHPSATHQASPWAPSFLQVGPEPEVHYFARLNKACPVPFRPAWREALWRLGRHHGLITPLPGHGMPGYRVDCSADRWAAVVKDAIVRGQAEDAIAAAARAA